MNRDQFVQFYERLEATRTRYTECIRITREDGEVYRFTAHDKDLDIEENEGGIATYKAADSFKMTALENQAGLVVSNMDIDAIISDASIKESHIIGGLFDNANVELFLAFWSQRGIQMLPLRTSWIGEIQTTGVSFKADLRGIAQKLQQMFVATTSLECRWAFGDSKCGVNKALYTRTVNVTSAESQDTFYANIALIDQGRFQWGLCTFNGGENAGMSMEIIRNAGNRIQLFLPMPFEIITGTSVSLVYGCDKVFNKGCNFFDNRRRFGGEPFLAGSDILTTYPTSFGDEEEDEGGK